MVQAKNLLIFVALACIAVVCYADEDLDVEPDALEFAVQDTDDDSDSSEEESEEETDSASTKFKQSYIGSICRLYARKGEVIDVVARRFGVSLTEFQMTNNLYTLTYVFPKNGYYTIPKCCMVQRKHIDDFWDMIKFMGTTLKAFEMANKMKIPQQFPPNVYVPTRRACATKKSKSKEFTAPKEEVPFVHGQGVTAKAMACACGKPKYVLNLNRALVHYGIANSAIATAAFIAQTCHESQYYRKFEESKKLREMATCKRADAKNAKGECVYYGRGAIQITLKQNYADCGKALHMDLLKNPEKLAAPGPAFDSAAWWWAKGSTIPRCGDLSEYAKHGLFDLTTRCIFGGHYLTNKYSHYKRRRKLFNKALKCLKEKPVKQFIK